MNRKQLMKFLKSQKQQIQFSNTDYNYTFAKVPYDSFTFVLFLGFIKKAPGRAPLCGVHFNHALYNAGFYSTKTNQLYDESKELFLALGECSDNCSDSPKSLHKLINSAKDAMCREIESQVEKNPTAFMPELIERHSLTYLKENRAYSDALKLFYGGSEACAFKASLYHAVDFTPYDIIDYVTYGMDWVREQATKFIVNNANHIAYDLLRVKETNKHFAALIDDIDGRHYKRRAMMNAITNQKSVKVEIVRNGVEFEFNTKARAFCNYNALNKQQFSINDMPPKDRIRFETAFGAGGYTEDDIVAIKHYKTVLYQAA